MLRTDARRRPSSELSGQPYDYFGCTVLLSFYLEICSSVENPCHADATCTQTGTDPGYICTCNEGYTGDGTVAGTGCTGTWQINTH